MKVQEFWSEVTSLPRAALVCAGFALAVNLGTYVGLRATGPFESVLLLHGAVMLLIAAAMIRLVLDRWAAQRARDAVGGAAHAPPTGSFAWRRAQHDAADDAAWGAPHAPLPRSLVRAAIGGGLYVVLLVVYVAMVVGEGSPEHRDGREVWVRAGQIVRDLRPGEAAAFDRAILRVISAVWFAVSLVLGLMLARGRVVRSSVRTAVA